LAHERGCRGRQRGAEYCKRGISRPATRHLCSLKYSKWGSSPLWGQKVVSSRIPRVSLRLRGRSRGPAEAEKWARFRPRVVTDTRAKDPAHLAAAFQLRPCQLLVGVKMQKWGRRANLRIKSGHTSGAAETANGARNIANGVFPNQQRATCAASSPASGVQGLFGVKKLSARESRVFHYGYERGFWGQRRPKSGRGSAHESLPPRWQKNRRIYQPHSTCARASCSLG